MLYSLLGQIFNRFVEILLSLYNLPADKEYEYRKMWTMHLSIWRPTFILYLFCIFQTGFNHLRFGIFFLLSSVRVSHAAMREGSCIQFSLQACQCAKEKWPLNTSEQKAGVVFFCLKTLCRHLLSRPFIVSEIIKRLIQYLKSHMSTCSHVSGSTSSYNSRLTLSVCQEWSHLILLSFLLHSREKMWKIENINLKHFLAARVVQKNEYSGVEKGCL